LFAFFIPFFILKLTLFQGMDNTYALETHNQISLSAISSSDVFFYLFYSGIILFIAGILSFYFAPVFFALYGYNAMNEENKKIYLFTAFSFVIMIGAIAYTISIREDLGNYIPRLHMRYIMPLVIPLMIQCLDFLFHKTAPKPRIRLNRQERLNRQAVKSFSDYIPILITVFSAAAVVLIPRGPDMGYFLDHYTLRSLYPYTSSISINMFFMLQKILLIAVTSYGIFLIMKRNKKVPVIIMLLFTMFIVNAHDNFQTYTSVRYAKISEFSRAYFLGPTASHMELAFCKEGLQFSYDLVDALVSLNSYIDSLDGEIIVFVPGDFNSYTDTYLNPRAFPITPSQLYSIAVENGGWLRMDAQPLVEGNRHQSRFLEIDSWKRGVFRAEYIITIAEDVIFDNYEIEHVELPFIILRNLDPEIVYIAME